MEKQRFIVKDDLTGYQATIDAIDQLIKAGQPFTVEVMDGVSKQRSLSANSLQACWIAEIAKWQGHDEKYVRNFVKAELALPILLEDESSEIANMISYTLKKIDYDTLSPSQRIHCMDMFNVTSVMTTKQHKRFLKQMQAYYANAGLVLVVR